MKQLIATLLLSWGIVNGLTSKVQAETAQTAPAELTEAIAEIEAAANQQDLGRLLEYYSEDFSNSDGLTTDSLAQGLEKIWDNYPQLKYQTELVSWSEAESGLMAETITKVEGVKQNRGRTIHLNSTIKSRQYFQEQKLVKQEILAEQSQITSGEQPPQVEVIAPETVKTGDKYNFDIIVDRPLEDKVLLGAIQEEKTASNLYLDPTALELEPLPAGGIYQTATAPLLPASNWVSAILVRGDGITMITHRVNIEAKPEENQPK